jgi:hypothetical protein
MRQNRWTWYGEEWRDLATSPASTTQDDGYARLQELRAIEPGIWVAPPPTIESATGRGRILRRIVVR